MAKEKDDDAIEDTGAEIIALDDTAAKAAEIGKDLGVAKEEIPDYDVQEEADERIAKTRDPATSATVRKDRKELTNKEKRDARKQRTREKFNEKDAIIAEQAARLDEAMGRLAHVEGRLSGVDKGQVKSALNDTIKIFEAAEQQHADAFKDGDGEKATKAMRDMYTAQKRIDELKGLEQRLEQNPQRTQQQQKPQFDAAVTSHAKDWAKRNSWFKQDANGQATDEDSEIAMALSARLVKEGFDPKSQDFWDELDDRAQKRLPHVVDGKQEEDEDEFEDDEKPAVQRPRKRTAPPVNGGANRGDVKGKVAVQVSTDFVNELKKNGLWEDKAIRDSMVHEHLKWKREHPEI